jgi:hypothetical protein
LRVDFRGKITKECNRQAAALIEHHGLKSRADLIELLVRIEYRRLETQNIYSKAAAKLSHSLKLSRQLAPAEIEKVSFNRGTINVYTAFSGEPYLIRESDWSS